MAAAAAPLHVEYRRSGVRTEAATWAATRRDDVCATRLSMHDGGVAVYLCFVAASGSAVTVYRIETTERAPASAAADIVRLRESRDESELSVDET